MIQYKISEITIPYFKSGETLRPGSIKISNPGKEFHVLDDSDGNLYKSTRSDLTESFYRKHKTILEWDFSTLYSLVGGYTSENQGRYPLNALVEYNNSNYSEIYADYYNILISNSEKFDNKSNGISLHRNSYIRNPYTPEFNLINGSFLIKFKIHTTDYDTMDTDIISCNRVKTVSTKGEKLVVTDYSSVKRSIINNEIKIIPATQYPYNFKAVDNVLMFSRSDGNVTTSIEFEMITPGEYDIQVYRYPSGNQFKISMFINGELFQTVDDNTKYCSNQHDLIIGNYKNNAQETEFKLTLSSVQIFNSLPTNNISEIVQLSKALYNDDYNSIIGQVFYKNGQLILNSRFHQDRDFFDNCTVEFESIHTIYEHEALVRIGKGEFNLSQNPSARVAYDSDIMIEEFQTGLLNPYITSIGLYDKDGNLLVIGKLAQAIEIRSDVDITFSIQWSI
jgi:hypothetical protein